MKTFTGEARAGESPQTGSDTVLSELTDCAMTVGVLIVILVIPALLAGAALWLLSAAVHAMGLTEIVPFPH